MIKIGNNDISKIYLGSTEIEKIYQGDTAIYSGGSEPTPPSPDYSTVVEEISEGSYLITVWFEYDQANNRLNGLYTGVTTLLLPQGYTETGNLTIMEEEGPIGVGYEITYFDNLNSSPYIEVDIPMSASVSVQFNVANVGSEWYFYIENVPSELFNWSDGTKYKFEIEADNLEV